MGRLRNVGWAIVATAVISSGRSSALNAQDGTGALKPGQGRISGVIVLEDGTPATVEGDPYTDLYRPKFGESSGGTYFSSEDSCKDRFSIDLSPGTLWMTYYAKGYAPAYLGPLEVAVGQEVGNLRLVLKAGKKATVRMVSSDGKPIRSAKIVALPILVAGTRHGPTVYVETNDKGEYQFEHLADLPYSFEVKAPGHEPLSVEGRTLPANEVTEMAMTRSLPATGTVLNFDGTPAKGAKICFRLEMREQDRKQRSGGPGYGEAMATTDEAGNFTLDQLVAGAYYLFVVESADKSRIVARTLRSGIEGVQIRLPKDQHLRVKLVGDIGRLPLLRGKPRIDIRQRVSVQGARASHGDLLGESATVTPTDDGGVVEYPGLVSGAVEIIAGAQKITANVVENGLTEVTIELDGMPPK